MPVINGGGAPTPTPTPAPTPTPVALTGTGGLFTRIGALGGLLNAINLDRGTTIPPHFTSINNQFLASNQDVIASLYTYLSTYQSAAGNVLSSVQSMANNTILDMISGVAPAYAGSVASALSYLIQDMIANSATVQAATVGGSIAYAGANIGNPVTVVSLRDVSGIHLEYAFNELVTGIVTADSISSPGLAQVEQMRFTGQPSVSNTLSWLYPAGSSANIQITATSPQVAGNNWTKNGSMETWTVPNVPDGWHYVGGTAGTQFLKTTTAGTFYDGIAALEIVGDGTSTPAVRQQFNQSGVAGDMTQGRTLAPLSQVAMNMFFKMSSSPTAGVLTVALTDASGTIINDAQGTPNSFTLALPTSGFTSWMSAAWAFRTPAVLPAATYLSIKVTTAITSGSNLFIDRVGLTQMSPLYRAGPFISVFSGNANMLAGDTTFLGITNNYGGAFQELFQKLFNMANLGLILPSVASSPTISDGLIA